MLNAAFSPSPIADFPGEEEFPKFLQWVKGLVSREVQGSIPPESASLSYCSAHFQGNKHKRRKHKSRGGSAHKGGPSQQTLLGTAPLPLCHPLLSVQRTFPFSSTHTNTHRVRFCSFLPSLFHFFLPFCLVCCSQSILGLFQFGKSWSSIGN